MTETEIKTILKEENPGYKSLDSFTETHFNEFKVEPHLCHF